MALAIDTRNPSISCLPSTGEMRLLDSNTIAAGVSSLELMERAGRAIAAECVKELGGAGGRRIFIACGPGNNGGDGLVIARLLAQAGAEVFAALAGAKKFSSDFLSNLDKASEAGVRLGVCALGNDISPKPGMAISEPQNILDYAAKADLVVDAILGTGQESAPRDSVGELTKLLVESRNRSAISVDIPTGINADTGEVYEPHVSPKRTICVQFIKRGLTQYPAHEFCGEISALDIGITKSARVEFSFNSASAPKFPSRAQDTHKNKQGHVLVIGGSKAMPGAPLLSARAALRAGAGLVDKVHLMSESFDPSAPELMLLRVKGGPEGTLCAEDAGLIIERIGRFSAVVIGPGLGKNKDTTQFFEAILPELAKSGLPCVIDADGLNILAEIGAAGVIPLRKFVLTPHPKEMARLLASTVEEVQRDRFAAVRSVSAKFGCAAILKGPFSVVYADGEGWVNTTGNPYMASAGSGDVLAGVVAGIAAQGASIVDAARLGCHLHGLSADILVEQREAPLVASDLIERLPDAIAAHSS